MLAKQFRLNLKTDFKFVASGKRLETLYAVLFIKQVSEAPSKIGIALTTKTFRRAHERNLAKRLVSAAFEELYSHIKSNIYIIALPKANILEVKSTQVKQNLTEVLQREGVLV